MDTTKFTAFLESPSWQLAAIVIPLIFGIIIWWKSGSPFTIWARLWTLFHGKASGGAQDVRTYLDNHTSVLQLRFITNIKARTGRHASRLIKWAEENDENLSDAARCGPYFDIEIPALKEKSGQPRPWQVIVMGIIGAVLAGAALTSTVAILPDRVLIRMNATDTWFLLGTKSAKPFRNAPALNLENCNQDYKNLQKPNGFTLREIAILCDDYTKTPAAQFSINVESSVVEQRLAFGWLAFMFGWVSSPLLRSTSWNLHAYAMRKRLLKKNGGTATDDQPETVEASAA